MRKFILTVMASLLSCSAAQAFMPEATESNLEIGVGYRNDSLKWRTEAKIPTDSSASLSDTSSSADPLKLTSDLHWKDLNIWFIEGRGKYVTCDNIYLRGSIDYGWVTDGKVRDKDKAEFSNEILGSGYSSGFEFAKTKADTKGSVYDAKIAIGYQFRWCDESLAVTPVLGYSWHGQHLRMHHVREEIAFDSPSTHTEALRSFSSSSSSSSDFSSSSGSSSSSSSSQSLKSRYHSRWNGWFIGFDLDYRFLCDWTFFMDYEYHWAQYHAKAKWNLRQDIVNGHFTQHANNAYGNFLDFGVRWDFCECWTLALRGEFMWWEASHGHDRARIDHESVGDIEFTQSAKTPLKHVKWDTAMVVLDLGWMF